MFFQIFIFLLLTLIIIFLWSQLKRQSVRAGMILERSKESFLSFLNNNNDGILIVDNSSEKFLYSNPAMSSLIGYSKEKLANMEVADIHPLISLEFVLSEFKAVTSGRKKFCSNMPCLTEDNKTIYCDIVCSIISYKGVKAVIAFFRDVTSRRSLYHSLNESEKRFRDIVDCCQDWVWELDLKGNITYSNNAVKDILGYSPNDTIGMKFYDFVVAEEKEARKLKFEKVLESKDDLFQYESENITKTGKIVSLLTKLMPVKNPKTQKVIGYRGVDRDITEYKQKESKLRNARNILTSHIKEQAQELNSEIEKRKKLDTELSIAGKIQNSVLPELTADFDNDKFQLYTKLMPAVNVSGDFYDFFYVDDKTLALVLADVAGKGIAAAFYMNIAKNIIKNTCLYEREATPGEIFTKVNEQLAENNEAFMFLTGYLFFYNIETGELSWSNAGHDAGVFIKANGNTSSFGIQKHAVLGCIKEEVYTTNSFVMQPGDSFLVMTDGISEALSKNDEFFGESRVFDFINDNKECKVKDLANKLVDNVLEFEGGSSRHDDITIMGLSRYS